MQLKNTKVTTIVTYSLLGVAAAAPFVLPDDLVIPSLHAAELGDTPPSVIELTGIVRDFKEWNEPGGHIDFDKDGRADSLMGCDGVIWCGNVDTTLGADGKPVFTGNGFAVTKQWTDSGGRPICYTLYDATRGDIAGTKGCNSTGGIDSEASFDQWYTNVAGVNLASPLTLRFRRQADGSYVFDDKTDIIYSTRGGFFPIEGRLFGNPPVKKGIDRNFHFTFELHTRFTYDTDANQTFRFVGDDDVWVFIDNKLVVDLGGIHIARDQVVDLNRLGLEDGKSYSLDFFFAERNRTQANFRMVTNLQLQSIDLTGITEQFD